MNVEDKLMQIFEYVKFDIHHRLSTSQNTSLKFDSDISHTSSTKYHQFHNEVNILQGY